MPCSHCNDDSEISFLDQAYINNLTRDGSRSILEIDCREGHKLLFVDYPSNSNTKIGNVPCAFFNICTDSKKKSQKYCKEVCKSFSKRGKIKLICPICGVEDIIYLPNGSFNYSPVRSANYTLIICGFKIENGAVNLVLKTEKNITVK